MLKKTKNFKEIKICTAFKAASLFISHACNSLFGKNVAQPKKVFLKLRNKQFFT